MGLRERSEAHTRNIEETGIQCKAGKLLEQLDADSLAWFDEWRELSIHGASDISRSKMAVDLSAELGVRMAIGTLNSHVIRTCCCYGVS